MTDAIDIKKVIQGSTRDMSVDSLTKKGVRQVKVVNQATITRLISDTIDRVLSDRSQEISAKERERVMRIAEDQLRQVSQERSEDRVRADKLEAELAAVRDELARRDAREKELQENSAAKDERAAEDHARVEYLEKEAARATEEAQRLRQILDDKTAEVGRLEGELKRSEAGVAALVERVSDRLEAASDKSGDEENIVSAIAKLTEKIDRMPAGGGGGGGGTFSTNAPSEVELDFLTRGEDVESNLDNISVKQTSAGDVMGALAKLKKLQQGEGGE